MQKTATQNDLIKYIYNESTPFETYEVEESLVGDTEFEELYFNLLEAKNNLDNLMLSPEEDVIRNIVNYSKSTEIHNSRSMQSVSISKN